MSRPVLSVCIPTYNRGEELASRVRAWLAAAEGNDFEIVVSDNASTDGTDVVFAAFSDPRLVYCRNERNVGAFGNQLRAFAAAHGTWLMQLTDKDEIIPSALPSALAALRGLSAACGSFRLVRRANDALDGSVERHSGASAYARFGLAYAHPSGCFFRADVLADGTVLDEFRALDEVTHPYSTDYLTSLCLRSGAYARISAPFVQHNLPPYGTGRKSVSYVSRRDYYFTPEFVIREFAEYLRFLRKTIRLSPLVRMRVVSGLVRRSLFPRMTELYRWALADDAICDWYGVSDDMRRSELSRDLEGDFLKAVSTLAADDDVVDALALRLGALGCRKAIARRRGKHEATLEFRDHDRQDGRMVRVRRRRRGCLGTDAVANSGIRRMTMKSLREVLSARYDFVCSVGSDCGCAWHLIKNRLRLASYPLDWVGTEHIGIEGVAALIARDFKGFFDPENLERNPNPQRGPMDDHKHDYYFDRGAGIIAVHDFPTGVPLDDSYPAVKAKYDRRIDRFYRTIRASRRVLLVYWTWRVYSKPEAILKAAEIFRAKFPEQRVDLLVIRNADVQGICPEILEEGVFAIDGPFHPAGGHPAYGDMKLNRRVFSCIRLRGNRRRRLRRRMSRAWWRFLSLFIFDRAKRHDFRERHSGKSSSEGK